MSEQIGITRYVLGLLGAAIVGVRLYTAWRGGMPQGRERPAWLVLTAALAVGALAFVVRVAPVSGLCSAVLRPDCGWLVADTLWLIAGLLGVVAADAWAWRARRAPPPWSAWRALRHARTFVLMLVGALLWLGALMAPDDWPALERGAPQVATRGVLPAAYAVYLACSVVLVLYFFVALRRLRDMAATRTVYLQLSLALLAACVYLASPVWQLTVLFAQWRAPGSATWPAFLPSVQAVQVAASLLVLLVLAPPRLYRLLLVPYLARERAHALAQLERFHTWLADQHAALVRAAPAAGSGETRAAFLLAEIERATRYALAYAPAGTRAALADLGEDGVYIAGPYALRAESTARLLAAALRAWPADRMPGELPRLNLIGDPDARLVFWGWVAAEVVKS